MPTVQPRRVLTAETLSRLAITPATPIAAFVKRLRCRRCGSQSVLATRRPAHPTAKGLLMFSPLNFEKQLR